MPYSGPDDKKLPANVLKMGKSARTQWVEVFNGAHASCMKEGGKESDCEASAFKQANGVMKKEKSTLRALWNTIRGVFVDAGFDAEQDAVERAESLRNIADKAVRAMYAEHPNAWPHDLFVEGSSMFLIASENGCLYRFEIALDNVDDVTLSEPVEVQQKFEPISRVKVIREASGRYRWLGVSASSVLNKDGEIDSTALFDDFVRRIEAGEVPYPYRTFYHLGEALKIGECDFMARDGVLLITSGTFSDNDLARAIVTDMQAHPDAWGDSIGYSALAEPDMVEIAKGVTVPVYSTGVCREISTVLRAHACNYYTSPNVMEVNRSMNEAILKVLKDLVGEDKAKELLAQTETTNRTITEEGMVTRDKTDTAADTNAPPAPTDKVEPPSESPASTPPAIERVELDLSDAATLGAIVEAVQSAPVVQALFANLVERVKALETTAAAQKATLDDLPALVQRVEVLEADEVERAKLRDADKPGRVVQVRATRRPRVDNAAGKDTATNVDSDAGDEPDADSVLASMPKWTGKVE